MDFGCHFCRSLFSRKRKGQIDKDGYIRLRIPVLEHRIVYEYHNKCSLLPWADVHHVNGIKTDNRPENLQGITHDRHGMLTGTTFKPSTHRCYFCNKGKTKMKNRIRNTYAGGYRYYRYLLLAPWNHDLHLCINCKSLYIRKQKNPTRKTKHMIPPLVPLQPIPDPV